MKNTQNDDQNLMFVNEYNTDQVSADKKLAKAQWKNTLIIMGIIVTVLSGIMYQNYVTASNRTYIDGNVLKIARTGEGAIGIPWKNASFSGQLTFRSLFVTDSAFTEVNPELAESITVSDDGLTYVITMKDGLKWSDGEDLDVDDVVFSFEAMALTPNTSVTLSTALEKIEGVDRWKEGETDGIVGISSSGNQITIQLKMPYSTFPLAMTQFVPFPEHILKDVDPLTLNDGIDFYKNPVCSGMFMVDKTNADGDLELIHNPYYEGTQTDIERVIMYGAYKTMNIDHYSTTNITEMVSYRSMTGFEEYFVEVMFYRYFVYNLMAEYEIPDPIPLFDAEGEPILDSDGEQMYTEAEAVEYGEDRPENTAMQDVRVRQAIAYALDIPAIVDEVYFGTATLVYGGDTTKAVDQYEYNLELAKQLLEEANYDFDRPFVIGYYHTDTATLVFLQKVEEVLESIGMDVIVKKLSGGDALYGLREYDMFLKALSAFNTEDWYNEYLSTNANLSAVWGTEGEFDELVHTLTSTTDPDVYEQTLHELVNLEQSLLYKMPLYTLNDSVYINGNRVSVPDDMTFGNNRYRSDLRLDEWYIKKG